MTTSLLTLHRHVVEVSTGVVSKVTLADLDSMTPCTEWLLSDLLAHMVGQHYGFAAAARGGQVDRAAFAPRPIGANAAADYARAAEHVLAAFSSPGLLDGTMYLPEVDGGMVLPAETAVRFHLIDYVAHTWDVARAIGVSAEFADEALRLALTVAREVPPTAKSTNPGKPFRPAVRTPSAAPLDRIVALLGRQPGWVPVR